MQGKGEKCKYVVVFDTERVTNMNEVKKKIFIVFDSSCADFSNDIDRILL